MTGQLSYLPGDGAGSLRGLKKAWIGQKLLPDKMLINASMGYFGLVGAWGWILGIWIAAIVALALLVFFVLRFGQPAEAPAPGEDPSDDADQNGDQGFYRAHTDSSVPFPPSVPREKPTTMEEFKEVALVIARSKHFFAERTDKEIMDNLKYEITPDEFRMLLQHTNFAKEMERLREEYPTP